MPTIAENLQTLIDIRDDLKEALDKQGKEPTDAMGSYAGLIDGLENPEKVVYMVTIDGGESSHYAQLLGEEKVELTATANDVRLGTSVISDTGYLEGEKAIPAYHTSQGFRLVPANSEFKIQLSVKNRYDYTKFQAMIMPFNTSISDSVAVDRSVIDDNVYNVNSTEVIAKVTKDDNSKSISLGITNGDTPAVIRYFSYKEVP